MDQQQNGDTLPPDVRNNDISFRYERLSDRSHNVTAAINRAGEVVFNEGAYYPRMGSSESREVDEYATVATEHREQLLQALLADLNADMLPAPLRSGAELTLDQRLFLALRACARASWFQSLEAITAWLKRHGVPYTYSEWIDID
ncbi:MAG TPA: hypothetical protein VFS21_38820 [Roseiflexaceae bacterium]|nr:hypothetical protein [Roseiflexaceae bacterium]